MNQRRLTGVMLGALHYLRWNESFVLREMRADLSEKILPFLMFQDVAAEAAMNYYVSLFPGSKIDNITRYGPGGPGPEGSVMRAQFTVAGQTVLCIDSPIKHQFGFTPSFSFWVNCESDEEINRLVSALLDGGQALMPLDNYGFSRKFAWLSDRFGVSWQLNLQ